MAISLTINGQSYLYPETGDVAWGPDATDWAVAVTSGMLQKAGGLFQLLGEVDFGTTYGIKALYLKSRTANPAAAGQIRLAQADTISWRNLADDADIALSVSASSRLTLDTIVIPTVSSVDTLINKTIDGDTNFVQNLPLTSLKTVLADADKVLRRDASGVVVSGNVVPNSSTLVTTDAAQTLTNKTVDGDTNTVQDLALTSLKTVLADANKVLQRDASGIVVSGPVIPAGTGDLVTLNGTQTLTNKTLTSPAITTPTGLVKGDVGLGNVDNTSDATKNAAAVTLTNKTITSPVITTPTGLVKGDVGLGNVDNTSDATKNAASVTLTNKTISGSSNTLTVLAASQLSGATPIANGGTGQTAQTAAFDALSPVTTKGDLIGRSSSNNVRVAIGTDGYVLTADAASTAGVKWAVSSATVDPTGLSNANATQLGFFEYVHNFGGGYNGGGVPSLSTVSSVQLGLFYPYQTKQGTWRMRFNIQVTVASSSRPDYLVHINGVTFYNGANQQISGSTNNAVIQIGQARAQSNDDYVTLTHSTATTDSYAWSGDVALASKPTWAY